MQIHATNVTGIGAIQVIKNLLSEIDTYNQNFTVYVPEMGELSRIKLKNGVLKKFHRILPNSISRFFECYFSSFLFNKNSPTLVLGDMPLRGIKNQTLFVHQSNLVSPRVNKNVNSSIKFKVIRWWFNKSHKYCKTIIVQTKTLAEQLRLSYPEMTCNIKVCYQPPPAWLDLKSTKTKIKSNNFILFYPSAYYPHKKHDFLIALEDFLKKAKIQNDYFTVWVTLEEIYFEKFKHIPWIKNLGKIDATEMNIRYSQADCLLFLSSTESYGLPLVEAMFLNKPIIVADHLYSKELCEDYAYYFKPYDENSFLKSLHKMRNDLNKGYGRHLQTTSISKFPKEWGFVARFFIQTLNE